MFRSYRIGSIAGFPIEVNLSFLVLLGMALLTMGGLIGVFIVLIAFASVLLHELGHALTARHLGVHIAGIELSFFGGAAKMTNLPKSANDEVLIAAAGPAVSFTLGGLGFAFGMLTGLQFFQYFGWINLVLGVFNLLPALPMDGGRILRALLTRKYRFVKATDISVTIARGFAVLFAVYGVAVGNFFLPLLAVLLWFMGTAERRMARFISGDLSYDKSGYHRHSYDVYPADVTADPWAQRARGTPWFNLHRPVQSSGFIIRQRNGRLIIEFVQ